MIFGGIDISSDVQEQIPGAFRSGGCNSARGHLMALEDKRAMEGYLETMMQGTTLKQKAYGTLVSSDMHAETIEQLVSLPCRAVVLRYFEEEMRTTPKIHALIAVPFVRTKLQLRFAWCMIGLTRGEYDSEERKRSKEEKVFLMTNMRDLVTQEEAAKACAKRRDALCFIRFMIEQISVPALNTCLSDSSQHITIVIMEVMMAICWLEAHVKVNNRQ